MSDKIVYLVQPPKDAQHATPQEVLDDVLREGCTAVIVIGFSPESRTMLPVMFAHNSGNEADVIKMLNLALHQALDLGLEFVGQEEV